MRYGSLRNKGFTIIELVITLGIVGVLAGLSAATFASFSRAGALDANIAALAASLRDARSRTLASVGGMNYGVYVEQDRFTVFSGTVFSSAHPANETFFISSSIRASSSVSSFVFEKLTGNAAVSGIIELYPSSDPSKKKSIRVENTGLIHIE